MRTTLRLSTGMCSAVLGAAIALGAAPAQAQLVCQKTAGSGKLTFKLRDACKSNETQVQDLGAQPEGFLRQQSAAPVCLVNAAGTPTPVFQEFQLPPGEWLLQAKVDVVNLLGAGSDFFRCSLTVDGSSSDGSTAYLTNLQVGDLTLIAHAPGGSMVGVACSHDGAINNALCGVFPGEGAYVEGGRLAGTNLKTFSVVVLP